MNLRDPRYGDFALVREMLETPDGIRRFDPTAAQEAAVEVHATRRLLLTGEGSSRIFPAKNAIYENLKLGCPWQIVTEGARQAQEYELSRFAVFGASNSGRTKEVIALFSQLAEEGHERRFGLTAHRGVKLEEVSVRCYYLTCGSEEAVAATKSVVEQALFYRAMLAETETDSPFLSPSQKESAAEAARSVLEMPLDGKLIERLASAPLIYFAGRNTGVAEELTLKTNEITHKKSDYLEGTYAVHGIEEVMRPDEVVVLIDPFPSEIEKFREVLAEGVGMTVLAVSAEETPFPTIRIPQVDGYDTVLQLLAGWNLLVEVGVALGINLDKAERARKIGNAFPGS
ncbi:SIS domain-containing protein [Thermopirellula anaerolimosa]